MNTKAILFARWLATSYADEYLDENMRHSSDIDFDNNTALSVLNRENGEWYEERFKYFNENVIPNYIENGSYKEEISLSKLYYKYKKTDDKEIMKYLEKIKIVTKLHGFYLPATKSFIESLNKKPRGKSLTFDFRHTIIPVIGLKHYKTITFLVKSSSRFFLKPDIGEIFDQMDFRDLHYDKIKAVSIVEGSHELIPDTDMEHFLMKADLFV